MSNVIKELTTWNMDTISVPDGYDLKDIPVLTRDNLIKVIDKQNEIIESLNILLDKRTKED